MNDVLSRVKAIQAEHGWNFDRSFQFAMSEDNHTGSFGRDPVDKSTKLEGAARDGERDDSPGAQVALVQASHRDWTKVQCETHCWEHYWS
jgi:hypothetical protein